MFAAGCFWGVESAFREIPGVKDAICGYSGGHKVNPTYREVCTGSTGHAEVVEVTFDPKDIPFAKLLSAFWQIHNPTELNRQGPDVGHQYRSAIFCYTPEQQAQAEASKKEWAPHFSKPIVTEIKAAGEFYRAEEYHQRYFEKNGGAACHIKPNLS